MKFARILNLIKTPAAGNPNTNLSKENDILSFQLGFLLQKLSILQNFWSTIRIQSSLFADYAFNESIQSCLDFVPSDITKLKFLLMLCTIISYLGLAYVSDQNPDPFFVRRQNVYCSKTFGSDPLPRFPNGFQFGLSLNSCREQCIADKNCSAFTYGRWEKGYRSFFGFSGYYGEMRCQLYSECKFSFRNGTDTYLKSFNIIISTYLLNIPINILALFGGLRCTLICLSLATALLLIQGFALICTIVILGISSTSFLDKIYLFLLQSTFVYLLFTTSLQLNSQRRERLWREIEKSERLKKLELFLKREALLLGHTKMKIFTWTLIVDLVTSSITILIITVSIIRISRWIIFDNTFMSYLNLFSIFTRVIFGIVGDKVIYVVVLTMMGYAVAGSNWALVAIAKIKAAFTTLLAYDINSELTLLAINIAQDALQYENQILEAIVTDSKLFNPGHRKERTGVCFHLFLRRLSGRHSKIHPKVQNYQIPAAIHKKVMHYINHKSVIVLRKCLLFDVNQVNMQYVEHWAALWNGNGLTSELNTLFCSKQENNSSEVLPEPYEI